MSEAVSSISPGFLRRKFLISVSVLVVWNNDLHTIQRTHDPCLKKLALGDPIELDVKICTAVGSFHTLFTGVRAKGY